MNPRRNFLKYTAIGIAGLSGVSWFSSAASNTFSDVSLDLKPMTDGIIPITDNERWSRIRKAKNL